MIVERAYQTEAVNSVLDYWANDGGNPLIEMATGTGKSVVIASLCKRLLANWPDMRILQLVHVRELVQQNATAMLRNWPQAPVGINSAGLGRRDRHSKILFAGIQSVYRSAELLGPRDVVMIDEAHLLPRDGEGMYRSLLETLRDRVPDLRICGFTATPYRLDSGRLDDGTDRLFDEVVYSYDLARGVNDGYLSPLISRKTDTEIDVSGVARRGGEFVAGSLEHAADRADVVEGACDEMVRLAGDRKSWLAFCVGIAHAEHVRDALRARSVSCEMVTGKTPKRDRDRIFRQFKEGRIKCLAGVQVFTTGFDAPGVDLIGLLRPTLSTGLYVQMLGRGTRLADGKDDCLVLDFAGNVRRHGPVDAVSVTSKKKGESDPKEAEPCPKCQMYNHPAAERCSFCDHILKPKICPQCEAPNVRSTSKCTECGFEWKADKEPRHGDKAEGEPVMTREIKDKWIKVDDVFISRHQKFAGDGPDSLVIEYLCGYVSYREWVCPEHTGYALARFERWWRVMTLGKAPPKSINEALDRVTELGVTRAIMIVRKDTFWRVVNRRVELRNAKLIDLDDKLVSRPVFDAPKKEEDHAAILHDLKMKMADAHPDRGGTDEAFIAARAKYLAAKKRYEELAS
jgi:DNA repair protein RadD